VSGAVAAAAGLAALLVAAAGVVVYRIIERFARRERIDAYLAELGPP
jgi:hypothetical protein